MKCPALKMGWHSFAHSQISHCRTRLRLGSAVASEEGALIDCPEEKEKTVLIIFMLRYLCSILLIKVIS